MTDWYDHSFSKSIGTFDRIEVMKTRGSDWAHLVVHVGNDVEEVRMTFRSKEAIRDLHYAIGRLLASENDE